MQRKENFCAHTGFELSISRSQNAIYFSIVPMPKKPHFTIFVIHSFVQNTKNIHEFHLKSWHHVLMVNEWC